MSVLAKLQIRPGQSVAVLRRPEGVALELSDCGEPAAAEAAIVFVTTEADLHSKEAEAVLETARRGASGWVAYPKAGQLRTDLNRDRLVALLSGRGVHPVRQVAIDDVWSALRFRPAQ